MTKLPSILSTLVSTLEAAQASTPQDTGGDFLYLKMSKAGEWVYGAEETEVGSDSAFVIDPSSYAQGFIAWSDGELIAEAMAVAGQPPILQADLQDLPAGVKWDAQVSFALKGIEGAEDGLQLLYKVSSKGGKGAVAELLSTIITRGKAGNADLCPVVMLDKSSYKHKKYGKIYTPILTVDEWLDMPDANEPAKAVAKPEPEPEPVVEPEPEPEPVAKPAPKRKRVRKSA